ncbi:hypothetical protein GWP85_07275 [Acinetobacter beijerinckii]|uniref:hypothetical protein n=1 Tax=Acinetobacter beijerinckii TaxID=262668 RepID=UPI0023DE0D6B|nr:hypothetical protein [Acinetobacter beijerinckii]MDF2417316.1 hypothetical protein [Acinetobacter beijerinckii]
MQLLPDDGSLYPKVIAGSIEELAMIFYQKLQMKGYSLLAEDVTNALIEETKRYAGCATFRCHRGSAGVITIDKNIVLEGFEWFIIEPCFSANCDLIQAQLVEASRSMGGDGFGMSVSEAEQAFNQAKELMPKNAFVEPPFSFKTLGGN